jgi:predicted DCC family thiol-disulfide oxidoreductase YuxK
LKVFYDDKCSICKREIKFYKKRNIKNIHWIAIHKDSKKLDLKSFDKENLLKKMHIVDDNNKVRVGVEAFIALWRKDRYFKYLAIIISIYPLKSLASFVYLIFANYRFKKLYKSNN